MLKISAVICLICLCHVDALPHCKVVELPEGVIQRNTINVIYTMESSCKYCTRKASILPDFKASLQNSGISAHFIVAVDNKSGRLSGLSSHLSINRHHVWKALGEQNNHFYIIDRCGRLVYEVINPWSSLQMPFLRGAIIATQFSHPCGLCPQDYAEVKEENLKIYPPILEETQSYTEEIPLSIVMRLRHKHHGDSKIYNHIVMSANGMRGHHRHLPHETNNKINHKSTFNLNIPEENGQADEASSISDEAVSGSRAIGKKLGVEHPINSIKNLESSSLQMTNETQLTLGSSDRKDNVLVNNVTSDRKDDVLVNNMTGDTKDNVLVHNALNDKKDSVLVNYVPSDTKDYVLVNNVTSDRKDDVLVNNMTSDTKENVLVHKGPNDMKDSVLVNYVPSETKDYVLVNNTHSDKKDNVLINNAHSDTKDFVSNTPSDMKDNVLVNNAPGERKDNSLVNSAPSNTNTEINLTEHKNLEKSQNIDNSREETTQELNSSNTDINTEINYSDEEISGDDYNEVSEESQIEYENSQLSSSELAEKQNLKDHYRRILDWIKYDY